MVDITPVMAFKICVLLKQKRISCGGSFLAILGNDDRRHKIVEFGFGGCTCNALLYSSTLMDKRVMNILMQARLHGDFVRQLEEL